MSSTARDLRNGVVGFLIIVLAVPTCLAGAAPPGTPAVDGEAIFGDQCASCHSIGGGQLVGPDLKGVTQRRDRQWLASFIAAPGKVIASGDPTAATLVKQFNNLEMPGLGLSQSQVEAVVAYLEARDAAGSGPAPTESAATGLPAGDPKNGEALFMGQRHLAAGGPPCMGCHSTDRAGVLGGGVLGPNLTGASARYGDAGLASSLASIPWPTMKPVFDGHPLALEEQADLRAFLQAQAGQPVAHPEALFLGLSLAGFLAAMVAIWFIWRRRLRGVRRTLLDHTAPGAGDREAGVSRPPRRLT